MTSFHQSAFTVTALDQRNRLNTWGYCQSTSRNYNITNLHNIWHNVNITSEYIYQALFVQCINNPNNMACFVPMWWSIIVFEEFNNYIRRIHKLQFCKMGLRSASSTMNSKVYISLQINVYITIQLLVRVHQGASLQSGNKEGVYSVIQRKLSWVDTQDQTGNSCPDFFHMHPCIIVTYPLSCSAFVVKNKYVRFGNPSFLFALEAFSNQTF